MNTNIFGNIERVLGLHQELRIIYVVDGFSAEIFHEEAYGKVIAEATADNIFTALVDLDRKLIGVSR